MLGKVLGTLLPENDKRHGCKINTESAVSAQHYTYNHLAKLLHPGFPTMGTELGRIDSHRQDLGKFSQTANIKIRNSPAKSSHAHTRKLFLG